MQVLIAEDEKTTRLMLARSLERWGYQVVAAVDGAEAWEVLSRSRIRLVVSDWEMPGLDGPSLCRKIRAQTEEYVYVLMLTSHKDPLHIVQGLDAGADDFVSKPFSPAELRARLGVGQRILMLQDALSAKYRELERANAQLERVAATDPLMNVGNRRSFEETIDQVHARAVSAKNPYGLIMIDVDRFKWVNDRYGHPTGDRVLAAVASTLRTALDGEGELFRYGGEEIALIVPDQKTDRIELISERLRRAVEDIRLDATPQFSAQESEQEVQKPLACTASFGVVSFLPGDSNATDSVDWRTLLKRADEALYAAKVAGRNRVEIWKSR